MGKKIKKIIAREGLVILSIAIAFFVVLFLMNNLPYPRPEYRYTVTCLGKEYQTVSSSRFFGMPINNYNVLREILEEHPREFNETITFAIKDGGVPKDFEISLPEIVFAPDNKTYRIFEVLIAFLIFAYPIHLIYNFIVWAVRTLREK